ncbi:MAG: 5'/3'-nucleotidase SurE, partial [Candidatus Bathyarchaeia archaeon]
PDLVISGINGGPNLGREWFTSGTIGAARLAAYWGLPAIAVSGLDITIPGSITAVTKWIVKLAQSAPVRELRSGQFLTVSIPRVPPSKIRGLRIVHRAPPDVSSIPFLVPVKSEATSDGRQLWQLQRPSEKASESEGDVAAYEENFIAIVPMNVDENDYDLILELNKCLTDFPNWANTLPETD